MLMPNQEVTLFAKGQFNIYFRRFLEMKVKYEKNKKKDNKIIKQSMLIV